MGQKVHPIGFRVGISRTWESIWFAEKKDYTQFLHEDLRIRKFLKEKLKEAGISRFEIIQEIKTESLYRKCKVDFRNFKKDLNDEKEEIKFTDLELIFNNLKSLFNKQGYLINWKELEKQSLNYTINTLSMVSPFSLEE